MIGSIKNIIIPYRDIEVQEYLEEDEEDDIMQLYKETYVGTYVVSQKVIKEEIKFSRWPITS